MERSGNMKVLICSDTHRNHDNFMKVLEREKPLDMLIHCGDTEGGEYLISEASECPCQIVMGNNDFFANLPREAFLELGGKKVWVTHGHNYSVSVNTAYIREEARLKGADAVFFGHSHKPLIEEAEGILCVNPGSLSYPRQAGRRASYVVLEIDKEGVWSLEIKYV